MTMSVADGHLLVALDEVVLEGELIRHTLASVNHVRKTITARVLSEGVEDDEK